MAGVWIRRPPVKEPLDTKVRRPQSPSFDCPVCIETFTRADEAKSYTMACGHTICHSCLGKCLQTTMACPICRNVLLNERAQLGFPYSNDNMLSLFILNPSFFAVPGSSILLRVFEPRYLILVKRCIATETCFGLQAGFRTRRGLLISIKRWRELPEGHIILEGLAVARYEALDDSSNPEEEPETFGLYRMRSKILADHEEDLQSASFFQLSKRAEQLLEARFNKLSGYEKDIIAKVCGVRPSANSYEFSFWLLGALYSPEPKASILFNPSAVERVQFCLDLLESNQPFECLMDDH